MRLALVIIYSVIFFGLEALAWPLPPLRLLGILGLALVGIYLPIYLWGKEE